MVELVASSDLQLWLTGDADQMVAAAEAAVRAYCGWHIYPAREDTATLDGPGDYLLLLPSLHVVEVTTITETATFTEGPLDVDLSDGLVQWSTDGRVIREGRCWTTRLRGLEVTFTHGYDDIPLELQGVVLSLASRAAASPGGVTREQVGPFAYTYSQSGTGQSVPMALFGAEMSVLDHYKIPLIR